MTGTPAYEGHGGIGRTFLANRSTDTERARVNVRTLVNAAAIRNETRDGRDVIIVPSATMPADIVMNGVRYPADEIAKSYATLENTLAPLGHPMRNDQFLEATHPVALQAHYCGAHNENVRLENGRLLVDKIIDIEIANGLARGRELLNAIDKGDPIHTSTGLWAKLAKVENGEGVEWEASDITYDHDAILLHEEGAATPEQGTGMLVNRDGGQTEVMVINSIIDDADREVDWAVRHLDRALEEHARAGRLEALKSRLLDIFSRSETTTANKGDADMSEEQLDALEAKVNAVVEEQAKMGETITNAVTEAVKPLVDAQTALANAAKAKDDAELAELRETIVKANVLDEATAAELTLNAARALAPKGEDTAAALNKATGKVTDDEFADYDPNAHLKTEG